MAVLWSTFVALGLVAVLVRSYAYEYDSNYEIPSDCKPCDNVKCPILTYCAGIKMKDRCGCCEWCSSDLFQPHAAPRTFPLPGTEVQTRAMPEPDEDQSDTKVNPCDQVKCSKYKVCMVNSQGLPLCTCPSVNICEPGKKKNKHSEEMEVCGSDGVTYKSRCHMRIANCINRRRIKRLHKGACIKSDIKTEVEEKESDITETGPFNESTDQERLKAIEKAKRKRLKRKRRKEKKRRRERERKERKERKNKKDRKNRRKRRNNIHPRSYGYYYLLGKKTNWGTNQVRRNRLI